MPVEETEFLENVFINCPFDSHFSPLFHATVFTVYDVGFTPRCALETSNAGQNRLSKILEIISECKYSIHDLSRTELDPIFHLPRFNMPFELGLDLGCRHYGKEHHNQKISLILDIERYRYQKFISDISGHDIYSHEGKEEKLIEIVRNWLIQAIDLNKVKVPGGRMICKRYQRFLKNLPIICRELNLDDHNLPYTDFTAVIEAWVDENPF